MTPEEKRAALNAILASGTLARSEHLRSFLRFVCEKEIAGVASQITEYEIGVQALGRPSSYSPAEDSSVRTRAYELRQRLQKYYSEENPRSAVRIELPKGTYVPRFAVAPPTPEAVLPPVVPAAPATAVSPDRRPPSRLPLAGVFLAGVAVAAAGIFLFAPRIARPRPSAEIRQAWGALATKDGEVLICLASPLHYLVSPTVETATPTPAKQPAPPEAYSLFSRYRPLPNEAHLQMEPVQKAMTLGSVQGLARVLGVLESFGEPYRILPETNSPLAAMRRKSVVLFGSPWYSRAASTLLDRTPFRLGPDPDASSPEVGILGTGTQAGKKFLPQHGGRGEYQEVFGLVTVLPSDPSADDGHQIVIFSGLTSAGTHGATAFFTSAADLAALREQFRREGLSQWPKSYQVVVRCRTSEDAQLLSYAYQTHVVIAR